MKIENKEQDHFHDFLSLGFLSLWKDFKNIMVTTSIY